MILRTSTTRRTSAVKGKQPVEKERNAFQPQESIPILVDRAVKPGAFRLVKSIGRVARDRSVDRSTNEDQVAKERKTHRVTVVCRWTSLLLLSEAIAVTTISRTRQRRAVPLREFPSVAFCRSFPPLIEIAAPAGRRSCLMRIVRTCARVLMPLCMYTGCHEIDRGYLSTGSTLTSEQWNSVWGLFFEL